MTVRIGVTGPIGCGKSTISAWLADMGAVVIDADDVAREVVEPGEPALAAVLATFGPAVRAPDGSLDRAALGRIVFGDPAALARLEAIVHPAVRPRIVAAMDAAAAIGAPAVVVEAIKLVDGGLAALCDEVWVIGCDEASQRARLRSRGLSAGDAGARMAAQASLLQRARAVAARFIDTSGTPEATRTRVEVAYREAIGEAART